MRVIRGAQRLAERGGPYLLEQGRNRAPEVDRRLSGGALHQAAFTR
jgi:hypothetical protein